MYIREDVWKLDIYFVIIGRFLDHESNNIVCFFMLAMVEQESDFFFIFLW